MLYLSSTVTYIFSVDYWRKIEMCVTGHSRSLKIVPFENFGMFLPCAAMHKRGLCCHVVSVCPSITFVNHVKTNKRIFKIFSPSGSQAILVFTYQTSITSWHYSDGDPPLMGASNARGNEKITIFDQYLALSLDRAIVTMENK